MNADHRGHDGRDRILTVARRIFLELGFAETSMQDIAQAAQVTKAALYYHFQDKNELFFTMLTAELERTGKALAEKLGSPTSFEQRLTEATTFLLVSMEGDLPRLVFDAFRHVCAEDATAFHAQKAPFITEAVTPFFREAASRSELRSDVRPELLTTMWLGMVFDQMRAIRMGFGLPLPADELSPVIVDIFLHGAGEPATV